MFHWGKICLFPVLNFYTHDEWKIQCKVTLLKNKFRGKISIRRKTARIIYYQDYANSLTNNIRCYFYQTLSLHDVTTPTCVTTFVNTPLVDVAWCRVSISIQD